MMVAYRHVGVLSMVQVFGDEEDARVVVGCQRDAGVEENICPAHGEGLVGHRMVVAQTVLASASWRVAHAAEHICAILTTWLCACVITAPPLETHKS